MGDSVRLERSWEGWGYKEDGGGEGEEREVQDSQEEEERMGRSRRGGEEGG